MKKTAAILTAVVTTAAFSQDVEQRRLPKLKAEFPQLYHQFEAIQQALSVNLSNSTGDPWSPLLQAGEQLWHRAVEQIKSSQSYDDRPLYWARLRLEKQLAKYAEQQGWQDAQYQHYWQLLEETSRGRTDIQFPADVDKRILLTGFDPFFLDRHIEQSNPSGVVAMLLDGEIIEYKGIKAQIETVLVPVRFADFDRGTIEALLEPIMASGDVDMVVTVSMGRSDFDLEHFPGKNRSADAPDNLNVYTGANKEQPIAPAFKSGMLAGPEFVEYSLPYSAMMDAHGAFKIHDNREIQTLSGKTEASTLAELADEISVSGSGGGYLSNEISYRSIVVRDRVAPKLPVGHIHTPRIKAFEPETNKAIKEQTVEMLKRALTEI